MALTSKLKSERCCCIFSVQLGTFILLYIELACSSIVFMFSMFYEIGPTGKNWLVTSGAWNGLALLCIIFSLILFSICTSGLVGLFKTKPSLLILYFIYRIVFAFTIWCFWMLQIFYEMNSTGLFFSKDICILIILELVIITVAVHFAQVVYSCYKQLEEQSNKNTIIIGSTQNPRYLILDNDVDIKSPYFTA